MADVMEFPNTWEEYEKIYGFNDIDQVYTNGSRLIPSFRVKQWLDHIADQHVQRVEYVRNVKRCRKCKHIESEYQTPISSDGKCYTYVVCTASECRYEPKTETQTDRWSEEEHKAFYTFLWNTINPNEMQDYIEMFE